MEVRRIEENVLHSPASYPFYKGKVFTIADIDPIIRPGDKIYFYYNAINAWRYKIEIDGEYYRELDYTDVICVVRDGEILPVGGHMLVEPYFGKDVTQEGFKQTRIKVKSHNGIITELVTKPKDIFGIVKKISAPLKNDEIGCKVGDMILFKDYAAFIQNIEGREYYAMYYWDALAIMEDGEV